MSKSVVFVDSALTDYQSLLSSIPGDNQVVLIDSQKDGLSQVLDALAGQRDIDAIHILGHGASGMVQLGTTILTNADLGQYQSQLAELGSHLTTNGDLLLYGCNVAAGEQGVPFVNQLARLTGADVAASTDITGKDGNWNLEYSTGPIEAVMPLSPEALAQYQHDLYVTGWSENGGENFFYTIYPNGSVYASFTNSWNVTADGNGGTVKWMWDGYYYANDTASPQIMQLSGTYSLTNGFGYGVNGVSGGGSNVFSVYYNSGGTWYPTTLNAAPGSHIRIDSFRVSDANYQNNFITDFVSTTIYVPLFTTGSTETISVPINAASFELVPHLHVTDQNYGKIVKWSLMTLPTHGTLYINGVAINSLSDDPGHTIAAGTDIIPANTTYTFIPSTDYSGTDTVQVRVWDGIAEIDKTMNLVMNDAPTINVSNSTYAIYDGTTTPDTATPFAGVTIADSGAAQIQAVTITLDAAAKGSLSNLGGGSYNPATGTYSFSGTASAATTAIHSLLFTPTANRVNPGLTETTTFTVSANDGYVTARDSTVSVISTSVDDPFALGGTTTTTSINDTATATPFSSVTFTDADLAQLQSVTVSLDAAAKGSFTTLSGFIHNPDDSYGYSGTAAQVQSALRGLVFTPTANRITPGLTETTTFTISLTNSAMSPFSFADSTTTVVATSVNNAPTIGGVASNQAVNDTATIAPFSTMTVADVDFGTTMTATVLLDTAAKGAFTADSLTAAGFVDGGSGSYTHTATDPATMQAALRTLVFQPAIGYVSLNSHFYPSFTVTLNDGLIGGTVSNSSTSLNVTAVNVPPTLTSFVGVVATAVEDTEKAITFADLTAQGNEADTSPGTVTGYIVKGVTSGTLRIGTSSATATAWNANSNKLIDGSHIAYWTPAANVNGASINGFSVTALDNQGAESTTAAVQVPVAVTSVDDAPAGVDIAITLLEDATCTLTTGDFSFTDPQDLPANTLAAVKITTLPAAGVLKYAGTAITATEIAAGYEVTTADITAGKLTFTPALNANGAGYTSFTFQVRDNGGTSNGGVDADSTPNSVAFSVTPVNDAPVLTSGTGHNMPNQTEEIVTDANNSGQTVASLRASMSDADTGVNSSNNGTGQGIAVYATTVNGPADGGKWQYSTDNGSTWSDVGTVSSGAALLLRDSDKVRFAGDTVNGQTANFSYYAWDQATGSAGSRVTVASVGGTTAFSTVSDSVSVTVTDLNDAPVLDLSAAINGTGITTTFRPRGTEVAVVGSDILITDPDKAGALAPQRDTITQAVIAINTGAQDNAFGTIYETLTAQTGVGGTAITNYSGSLGPLTISGNGSTTVTISGTGTWADYQSALQSVYYYDGNPNAFAGDRTVTVSVTDGAVTVGGAFANRLATSATTTIQIPWTPVVDLNGNHGSWTDRTYTTTFTEDGGTVAISTPDASITDEGGMVRSLTIALANPLDGNQEHLSLSSAAEAFLNQKGFTVQITNDHVITITSNDPAGRDVTQFQVGLRGVLYTNSSQDPNSADRTINVTIVDTAGISGVGASTTIQVIPTNDPAVAVADTGTTPANVLLDSAAAAGVLHNDTDVDHLDTHTVSAVNGEASSVGSRVAGSHGGDFTIRADGSYSFDPGTSFLDLPLGSHQDTSVTYTNSDNSGATSSSTLTITVTGKNHEPVAGADSGVTAEKAAFTVSAGSGVLVNDTDIDTTDTHTVSAVAGATAFVGQVVSGSGGGTFVVNQDGSYRFDPGTAFNCLAPGESATTRVNYTVADNHGATSSSYLEVTVNGAADLPVLDLNGAVNGVDGNLVYAARSAASPLFGDGTALRVATTDHLDEVIRATCELNAATAIDNAFGTTYETLTTTLAGGVYANGAVSLQFSGNGSGENGLVGATTLTLTGTGSAADYQAAFVTIQYSDANPNASAGVRPVKITLYDAENQSVTATKNVNVIWAPVVDLNGEGTEGRNFGPVDSTSGPAGTAVAVASPDAALIDQDGNIKSVTIQLDTRPDGASESLFITPSQVTALSGIGIRVTGSGTARIMLDTTNVNGLDGTFFQLGLRAVQYTNTATHADLSPRTVSVTSLDVDGQSGLGASTTINPVHVNIPPTVTDHTATATEGGSVVSGQLTGSDPDYNQADHLTYSTMGIVPAGFTLDNNGTSHFDPANSAYDHLAAGVTEDVTVEYRANDGYDNSNTATLTITVTGSNDAPVAVVGSAAATEGGSAVSGNVVANDIDDNHQLTYAVVGTTPSGLTFNSDGSYRFDPTNGAYDHLAAGATQEVTARFKANDGLADSLTSTLTITVTGSNNAPVATGTFIHTFTDTAAADRFSNWTGTLTATDVDVPDTLRWSGSRAGSYGALTINSDGSYRYVVNAAAVNALPINYNATDTFTATVTDSAGATATRSVTVNVTGTNDTPVITNVPSRALGSVTEGGIVENGQTAVVGSGDGVTHVSGQLSADDVDSGASITWSIAGAPSTVYGSISINSSTGAWDYALNNSLAATQALKGGEVVEQSYTARVADQYGAYADQAVTVAITGTNEAPTINGMPRVAPLVTAGKAEPLADFTVADAENGILKVSLVASNGSIGGLTDSDPLIAGIQLRGVPTEVNSALAAATFTANGSADPGFSLLVTDDQGSTATATYHMIADNAGVLSSSEANVPSLPPVGGGATVAGDGNGDGVADNQQLSVLSVPLLATTTPLIDTGAAHSYITMVADSKAGIVDTTTAGTAVVTDIHQLDKPALLPNGIQMPLGELSFNVNSVDNGVIAQNFSLFVDSSLGINGYWTQNSAGVWQNLATHIEAVGDKTRIDFTIADGGAFDSDHSAGSITNQGALAAKPLSIVSSVPVTSPGGFFF